MSEQEKKGFKVVDKRAMPDEERAKYRSDVEKLKILMMD